MKRQVLPQERVRKALDRFVTVELSVNRHAAVANRYGVPGSPTFLILDATGALVRGMIGYIPPEQFIRFLQGVPAPGAPRP